MSSSRIMKNINTYIETAFPSGKPEWTTDNLIIFKHKAFNLRVFGNTDPSITPTLIIPPQAGHSSHIADYDKSQSIVETILKERGGNVYVIEWLSCTYERKDESISDLVDQVQITTNNICRKHNIDNIHLVGLCQGGWLSAIFTSIFQHNVKTLTCIAAPIDFAHGAIHKMAKDLGMDMYRALVSFGGGLMLGDVMLAGWKSTNFTDRYIIDYLKIAQILDNEDKIHRTHKFRTWYENVSNLAGNWYLDAIENLFIENKLIKNELIIDDFCVDLGNITCPIIMIAGGDDEITLKEQLFALDRYSSSPVKYSIVIPNCGHIGAFIGRASQTYISDSIKWIEDII